jgi:hypothetical protein
VSSVRTQLPLPGELTGGFSCTPFKLTVNFCCAEAVVENIKADSPMISIRKRFFRI